MLHNHPFCNWKKKKKKAAVVTNVGELLSDELEDSISRLIEKLEPLLDWFLLQKLSIQVRNRVW